MAPRPGAFSHYRTARGTVSDYLVVHLNRRSRQIQNWLSSVFAAHFVNASTRAVRVSRRGSKGSTRRYFRKGKIAARGIQTCLESSKIVFGRSTTPDPAGGAHDAPPDPLVTWGHSPPLPSTPLGSRFLAPHTWSPHFSDQSYAAAYGAQS